MNILHITPVFAPAYSYGGPPRSNLGLSRGLSTAGNTVLVLTTDADVSGRLMVPTNKPTVFEGVNVIYFRRLSRLYYIAPGLIPYLWKNARKYDAALLRGVWTFSNFAASLVLKHLNIPYFVYPEGTLNPVAISIKKRRKLLYWTALEKRVFEQSSGIVTLSNAEKAIVQARIHHDNIFVIPDGVALPTIHLSPDQLHSTDEIVSIGRIHPIKGLELLVEAFAALKPEYPSASLVIAGPVQDSGYFARLRRRIVELDVAASVQFIGPISAARRDELLMRAAAFVLPSHSEGMPRSALEALAAGCPCVLTSACNLDQVASAGAGIVIDRDVSALQSALRTILESRALRASMSERARLLAKTTFSWTGVAERTLTLMEATIAREKHAEHLSGTRDRFF